MSWDYQIDKRALKELRKLGKPDQIKVFCFLDERIAGNENPQRFGKALKHGFAGLWRYRVGDIRLICQIKDDELLVLIVKVGNRRDVYD